ncbi:hypothetical protein [Enterobacter sp. CC120223-11]|uniref:hypothetical protein n=1 Tax=Enterobacter sp. CC120223-11 TaxID=1378073 RepID=UPI000BC8CF8B|nr:hypothetical protein [Enterobacter sp. CC120223-11]SNY72509.1 hypothetical protein SAMN02744775_02773 [Enterobacter sp. CC120223-11]
MKELSAVEVANVSGAGYVQDSLSSFFGNIFGQITSSLNDKLNTNYDVTDAIQTGSNFGNTLGRSIENIFTKFLNDISKYVIG